MDPGLPSNPLAYDYPGCVAHFEGRRVFSGCARRPGRLFFSASDAWRDYDTHLVNVSGEALVLELASRRREDALHLVELHRLVALSGSSAWSVGGAGGSLDFDSVSAQLEDEVGATHLAPLVLRGVVLYARAKGVGVEGLAYDGAGSAFRGEDLSWHADHLFVGAPEGYVWDDLPAAGRQLVDWCYARDPWGIVWAVRDDGVLLSLTVAPSGAAWARHGIAGGNVRAVCAVPEDGEDVVYLVVERSGCTSLERFASRVRYGTVDDDVCLDGAVKVIEPVPWTAEVEGTITIELGGAPEQYASIPDGTEVYVVAKGMPPQGPVQVRSGGRITIATPECAANDDADANFVGWVGRLYQPELETLDVVSTDTRGKQKTVVKVGFEVDESKGLCAGQDFSHLTEWPQRQVVDSYGAVSAATDLVVVPVSGTYDTHARAVLRQTLPLPVTVLGITRELDVGG